MGALCLVLFWNRSNTTPHREGPLSSSQKTAKPKRLKRERPAEDSRYIKNLSLRRLQRDCTIFIPEFGNTHLFPMSTFTPGQELAAGLHLGSTGRNQPGQESCVGCRSLPWGHPGSMCTHLACPGPALCSQHLLCAQILTPAHPGQVRSEWTEPFPSTHREGETRNHTEGSVKPALTWEPW